MSIPFGIPSLSVSTALPYKSISAPIGVFSSASKLSYTPSLSASIATPSASTAAPSGVVLSLSMESGTPSLSESATTTAVVVSVFTSLFPQPVRARAEMIKISIEFLNIFKIKPPVFYNYEK